MNRPGVSGCHGCRLFTSTTHLLRKHSHGYISSVRTTADNGWLLRQLALLCALSVTTTEDTDMPLCLFSLLTLVPSGSFNLFSLLMQHFKWTIKLFNLRFFCSPWPHSVNSQSLVYASPERLNLHNLVLSSPYHPHIFLFIYYIYSNLYLPTLIPFISMYFY